MKNNIVTIALISILLFINSTLIGSESCYCYTFSTSYSIATIEWTVEADGDCCLSDQISGLKREYTFTGRSYIINTEINYGDAQADCCPDPA